jgi:hypothetical protein
MGTQSEDLALWARSGAMWLTGRPEQPLGPPAGLMNGLARLGQDLGSLLADQEAGLHVDPLQTIVDRAAIAGLKRHGELSCGGRTRLLQSRDGWIALSLARADDVASVPAWLELDTGSSQVPEVFDEIAGRIAHLETEELTARGRLLGLPVAGLGSVAANGEGWEAAVIETAFPGVRPRSRRGQPLIVDLSALWAGPLCSAVLQAAGARVIKVESTTRREGARQGPSTFFDLLNGGKESVALDFGCAADLELTRRLLLAADVVVEASRPRALEQLGISATEIVAASPTVWISITGYGRAEPERDWVAFGDDAAVAGGLVVWDEEEPRLCADAIADPLTGLVAAAAGGKALRDGRSALVDVAMARVAAVFTGPTLAVPDRLEPCEPRVTAPTRRARRLGEDNEAVRREFAA